MGEHDYSVLIHPLSEEDGGGYMATVPDLPGCMSDGQTEHEALDNAREAIRDWIECARVLGREIPAPPRQLMYA